LEEFMSMFMDINGLPPHVGRNYLFFGKEEM
jgi:hypothetical protein